MQSNGRLYLGAELSLLPLVPVLLLSMIGLQPRGSRYHTCIYIYIRYRGIYKRGMYIDMYICMYVCMYVCMYIYVCIYICICKEILCV